MKQHQIQIHRCGVSAFFLLLQDLLLFEKQWSFLFTSVNTESPLSMQEMSEAQTAEVQVQIFRFLFGQSVITSLKGFIGRLIKRL